MAMILSFLKKYRIAALSALCMMLIELSVELIQPLLISKIIDNGIREENLSVVWLWGGVLVGSAILAFGAGIASSFFASHASQGFGYDLRDKLYDKVQSFSYSVFNKFETSSLITRLTGDITQLQDMVFMSLRFATRVPLVVFGSMIMALFVNVKLGLLLTVTVPILFIFVIWMMKLASRLFKKVQQRMDAVNGVIQENLTGMRLIRVFVRMGHEIKRFEKHSKELMKATVSAIRLTETMMPFVLLMMNGGVIAILWFGRKDIAAGQATLGEVVAVLNYTLRTLGALSALSWIMTSYSRASASKDRVQEVFMMEDAVQVDEHSDKQLAQGNRHDSVDGKLEFEKVGFRYPESDISVLEDISFTALPGQRIAIMGATGSGKSSLIRLIPRLYEPTSGIIRIDGTDIRQIPSTQLRGAIGYVPQEVMLFTGTIRENIAWGREGASLEQIQEAAKRAQIHETIESLTHGYDTLLGQRGVNLSGGQKQRLSIARALVRQPSILILDDCTSALDVRTEAALLNALTELSCTTFLITQKISSTTAADLILLLDEGCLLASGRHEELLINSTLYRKIYESQNRKGRKRDMFKTFTEPFRHEFPKLDRQQTSSNGRKPKARAKDWSGTLGRIWRYLALRKAKLTLVLLMVLCSSALALLGPYLVGVAVDDFLEGGEGTAWILFLAGLGLSYVGFSLTSWLQNIWMIEISQETVYRMRLDLFRHLHQLPIPFYGKRQQGEIMSRLTNDIENVSSTLNSSAIQIFSSVLTLVGTLIVMLYLSPLLTLLTFLIVPLMALGMRWISRRTGPLFKQRQKNLGDLNGYIEETLSGQVIIQAFSQEQRVISEFKERNVAIRQSGFWAQTFSGFIPKLMNALNNLSFAVVAGVGGILAIRGAITVGVIIVFVEYARQFTRPLNDLANQWNTLLSAIAGAERVFEIMDEEVEEKHDTDAVKLDHVEGAVVFSGVSFSYDEDEAEETLEDISFEAKTGEMIALVGPTGAGKTTLIQLLSQFYNPGQGTITVDGRDITTIRRESLRSHMAFVLQDSFLFKGTIRENIRFGRLDATDEEVEEASRLANAHSFIKRLPGGYDKVLETGGTGISQGQKQLLAIARAILANPSILVLDEATSSIDTVTEIKIQEGLERLMKGRTSFVIAHRLNTIRQADRILVLKDGRLIEQGSHDELLEQQGFYSGLYQG